MITLNKPIVILMGDPNPNIVSAVQEMVRKMREKGSFKRTPVVIIPADLTTFLTTPKFLKHYSDQLEAVVLDLAREGKGT